MIESLITVLRSADSRLEWREAADSLWLAIHSPPTGAVPAEAEPAPSPEPVRPVQAPAGSTPAPPVSRSDALPQQHTPPTPTIARLDPGGAAPAPHASERLEFVAGPTHDPLPGQLSIARALRPLRHRRRSNRHDVARDPLDVDATIAHYCATHELVPIQRPAAERWFHEAAIVVDGAPTMIVWRETIVAFARMLVREGAFDRVTRWRLIVDSGAPALRDLSGTHYSPEQLVEYSGRRLILLFTDCVSELWRDGAAWRLLELWGRCNPAVLVHTLPPDRWRATGVGSGLVTVAGHERGSPNRLLRTQLPWWSPTAELSGTSTPVVALDEALLGSWARMLMARDNRAVPAAVAPAPELPRRSGPRRSEPKALVRNFFATASYRALRLAVLLSAVEVDLPIARLILGGLVPGGRLTHLAEVLASGLLEPPEPASPEHFEFVPGTRGLLHESISGTDALDVWRLVAPHLERTDRGGAFAVVLDDAATGPPSAMATIAGALARRLEIIPAPVPPAPVGRRQEPEPTAAQAAEWQAQRELREIEFRTCLLARARGDHDDPDWWFSGRHAAVAAITAWLDRPTQTAPLLAITGDPGSGKTAILGLIATLSRPGDRDEVPIEQLGLPASAIPAPGAVSVAIYAQNMTVDQVRDGIAAAARLAADSAAALVRGLVLRAEPLTVLIDAIDEAADPNALVRMLLRPIAEESRGKLRLLVGTRRYLLEEFGGPPTIDLDAPAFADPAALADYAERKLREDTANSAATGHDPARVRAIAVAIAEQAKSSFLVAKIVATTLSAATELPDPHDRAWRNSLPRLPGEAMANDLRSRLGPDADRARHLLRPLAFAFGRGLPLDELLPPLAERMSGTAYTSADLVWLRLVAGSYLVRSAEAGYTAWRLYHRSLADHLAEALDREAVHRMFTDVLRARVPSIGQRPDWAAAHPYITRYLAGHAAQAQLVDEIIAEADYLVHAEPGVLLAALNGVHTPEAQLIRAVYRCSAAYHRTLGPDGRRRVLALDAARFGAAEQQAALNRALAWPVRWATGNLTHPAHRTTLIGHRSVVTAIACSTVSGRSIAVTGGHDRTVRIWELHTGTQQRVLTGHTDWITAIACTTLDGRPVALTTGYDRTIRIWNLHTGGGDLLRTEHTGHITAIACTVLDGRPVALTTGRDGTVRVWDLHTGTQQRILTGHTDWITAVTCTTLDGHPVALTTGYDRTIRRWNLHTGSSEIIRTEHSNWVSGIACARTGSGPVVITTGHDRTVRVHDLRTGIERGVFSGHTNWVSAAAGTEIDGYPMLVTSSWDHTSRVWELDDDAHSVPHPFGHTDRVLQAVVARLPGTSVVITAGRDDTARVWDLTTGVQRAVLAGHTNAVNAVAWIRVGDRPVAVTTSRDDTVRVWDLTATVDVEVLHGHTHWVTAVACLEVDGTPVAVTTSRDDTVRVWDLTSGAERAVLHGHTGPVNAVACIHVDGDPVAVTTADDGTVRVWDLRTGGTRFLLGGRMSRVNAVACVPVQGVPLAMGASEDGSVLVWDLRTGAPRTPLLGHTGPVDTVACSLLDGRPVAFTASRDRTVRVWDPTTATTTAVIDCPTQRPLVAAGSESELVIGLGDDIAVLSWRGAG